MNYFRIIEDALNTIGTEFKTKAKRDQLAYFAINSKPENMFRDWLAWRLYRKLRRKQLIVVREWTGEGKGRKAIDIAVVSFDARPQALIQLKVTSSFALSNAKRIRTAAQKDMDKCRDKCGNGPKRYYIHFAPHMNKKWKPKNLAHMQAVTYKWGNALDRSSPQEIKSKALKMMDSAFKGWHRVAGANLGREIPAGKAFDARVSILYWLCEN